MPTTAATAAEAYAVLTREGDIEERTYPAHWAVETSVSGERDDATHRGFLRLTAYLSGGGRGQAPPFRPPLIRTETARGWTVQLDLPADGATGAPAAPTDPQVTLRWIPAVSCVVMPIPGPFDFAAVDRQRRRGLDFAVAHRLAFSGPASVALYTRPGTVWFLQKAEFRIPIEPNR